MAPTTTSASFWKGMRDSSPFLLVVAPFGLLFGVLAAEAGLDVVTATVFSFAVFAGAAQLTALQLLQEQAPLIIVMVSALAMNLRMAMYSASLTPYLGDAPLWQRALAAHVIVDQSYALSMIEFETREPKPIAQRMAYFVGTSGVVGPTWFIATIFGALLGRQIPESWGLDFVLPLVFLSMLGPMLRTPAHLIACFTAVVVSLPASFVPFNLGIIIAGFAGMIAGAQAEVYWNRAMSTNIPPSPAAPTSAEETPQ